MPVQFPVVSMRFDESEVVATTRPVASVERRAFVTLEIARFVVVALVDVAFVVMTLVEVRLVIEATDAVKESTIPVVKRPSDAKNVVEVAFVEVVFWNTLPPVKVLSVYVLGIVVEEPTKYCAEVVENAAPWFWRRKYCAEVVDHESPAEAKYNDDDVEKKLLTDFQ